MGQYHCVAILASTKVCLKKVELPRQIRDSSQPFQLNPSNYNVNVIIFKSDTIPTATLPKNRMDEICLNFGDKVSCPPKFYGKGKTAKTLLLIEILLENFSFPRKISFLFENYLVFKIYKHVLLSKRYQITI